MEEDAKVFGENQWVYYPMAIAALKKIIEPFHDAHHGEPIDLPQT